MDENNMNQGFPENPDGYQAAPNNGNMPITTQIQMGMHMAVIMRIQMEMHMAVMYSRK